MPRRKTNRELVQDLYRAANMLTGSPAAALAFHQVVEDIERRLCPQPKNAKAAGGDNEPQRN
jgi:hypothetical protein